MKFLPTTQQNWHVFEDGSFRVNQYSLDGPNKIVYFGPMKTSLEELFCMGFYLQVTGWVKHCQGSRGCKIHLMRGREKYLVGKAGQHMLFPPISTPLQSVIRHDAQLIGQASTDHSTPFEQLSHKYPPILKEKTEPMMGNMTLRCWVSLSVNQRSAI